MVGLDHAVLGGHGGAFYQGQEVALHALARHIGALHFGAAGDLVDLVDEHDAVLFQITHCAGLELVVIDQLFSLLVGQNLERLFHLELARFLSRLPQIGEHALQLRSELLHAGRRQDFHLRGRLGHLDFDLAVVQFAFAKLFAEFLARRILLHVRGRSVKAKISRWRQQDVEHPFFGRVFGACTNFFHLGLAGLLDGDIGEVTDDGVHVAPDIADLGEFGGFDLDEWCVGQFRQAARDLGFSHAGRADHQDVLWRDLRTQGLGYILPTPSISKRDGDRLLGARLADDVLVEFVDNFLWGH